MSSSHADRLRELAIFAEALPPNPPTELYGAVEWQFRTALEFGRELEQLEDEFPDMPAEQRTQRAIKRIGMKRSKSTTNLLSDRVLKLEAEIRTALGNNDPGAHVAAAAWREATARIRQDAVEHPVDDNTDDSDDAHE